MVSIGITRAENESWLECALRHARPYGLEEEIRAEFEANVHTGVPERDAALIACLEWDVALIAPEEGSASS
ncbi:hypothetical protein [Rhizobium leguminosarum]|uniref:hypothetical protein n=1 Tax=Rhizobium leguminosarum TaxID=384 RepID=UPI00048815CE|nr:hypothetical protein [Rhizobium leguminosarum]